MITPRIARLPRHLPRQTLHLRELTTLGLRREDPSRIWERRTALTPAAVQQLLQEKGNGDELAVEVESCLRRCFSDEEYQAAGAKVVPSLSNSVDVVLGIKEPVLADVQRLVAASDAEGKKRTWMMFSHTHKGQEYNTPLLAAFLRPTQTLIDHELLTGPEDGKDGKRKLKRVAAFGWYAGAVGAGEALSLTGVALLKRGVASPLLHLPRPYTFGSLAAFKDGLRKAGDAVRSGAAEGGKQGPIVIGLTGAGNVSQGAKEMLEALGVEWVAPEKLAVLGRNTAANKIYACAITPESYISALDGSAFNKADYYASPDKYQSHFSEKIAPYLTTLVNGVGWSSAFPRTMTSQALEGLIASQGGEQKLVAVQDISCDKEGGLEFVSQFTTIDKPFYEGPNGILISTIDILPTELATDASTHFSEKILPFVRRALFPASTAGNQPGESATLERAQIVSGGKLTAVHAWLAERAKAYLASSAGKSGEGKVLESQKSERSGRGGQKRILLLGSGLVAGPAVEVFAARPDVRLAIASNNIAEARGLVKDRSNVEAVSLDVADDIALSEAVAAADVVVSLLPAPMHPQVAKHCIKHGRHLVTASYVSPEMKALNQQAIENDVLLLGECGLDPGIDSMAAMRILDRVQREGKKVGSFVSWCGGLPELGASDVPLRYKFSWSPKAVLTAAQNDAHYKWEGKTVTVPGNQLLAKHFPEVKLWDELPLEGLANRDSMPYAEKYGLGPIDGLTNLFRGTLRYQGFSRLLESFRRLGLLRSDSLGAQPGSWPELLLLAAGRELDMGKLLKAGDVKSAVGDLVGKDRLDETLQALDWFSLSPTSASTAPALALPTLKSPAPVDYFAHLLSHKLAYAPGERDTCLLHHAFELSPAGSTGPAQKVTASLLCYGTPQASAMSVTVGKTLAFAALRVADGGVKRRGVTGPYEREVWEGVLQELEEVGVVVEERWS
ncbi:hypothetical protein IAT38_004422 [Cryptococcus sp. DSM 104549]